MEIASGSGTMSLRYVDQEKLFITKYEIMTDEKFT